MSAKIRVLIVDDLVETRQNVAKLLQFESDIDVIGQASGGQEAIALVQQLLPDVVLMDINMPGVDGIAASKSIIQAVPSTQIIIMSVQSEADYLRRAMLAGARDFLMKPFSGEQLAVAIRSVYAIRPELAVPIPRNNHHAVAHTARKAGKILSVYSPKGGVGCSTMALNLAVQFALSKHSTLLLDGSFQFGDVGVMLNIKSTSTILDLLQRADELDADLINSVVLTHDSGLKVLLAPPRPEMAELVTVPRLEKLLTSLRQTFEYVIIDMSKALSDINLAILDHSDHVLLLTEPGLPSLKSASLFYDLAQGLKYRPSKIMLVVNRASTKVGVSVKDIAGILKQPVLAAIPEDDAAVTAATRGYPLVSGPAQRRPIATAITALARQLLEKMQPEPEMQLAAETARPARLSRLFGSR